MSLRATLLWLILAAVVPVLLFSGGMIVQVADHQREVTKAELAGAAARIANDVDTQLRETISVLQVLALSNALATDDLEAFYRQAHRVLAGRPGLANIQLVSAAGEHLVNLRLPYGARLPPLLRPDVFTGTARRAQPGVSDAVPAVIAQRSLTVVTVPVMRGAEVRYVLAAAVEAENWERIVRVRLPPAAQGVLLDRQWTIISRTLNGERFAGGKPAPEVIEALTRAPLNGTLRARTLEGVEAYGAYEQAALYGWTVAVFMPVEVLEAPVRALLASLAVGFLLLLTLSLALAWMFARRIADAMRQLKASVLAVGGGAPALPVHSRIAEVREASKALHDASTLLAERLAREQAARAGLEAADRAKDGYLTMLGHELRNPLAPMSASLYILEQEQPAGAGAQRALGVIRRQVGYMTRLIDDLLDVTRVASGKVTLQRETVDLNQKLARAAEDHAEVVARAGIELALEVPAEPVRVSADPTRLAQILGNLVQNAVRFTPAGGRIVLSLAREGGFAEIRVRDNGAGIEPHMLERLFRPFVQGAQPPARARSGLGLGLSLVKGLAELHGGSVQAFSAGPGQGAEFVVRIPALDPAH